MDPFIKNGSTTFRPVENVLAKHCRDRRLLQDPVSSSLKWAARTKPSGKPND